MNKCKYLVFLFLFSSCFENVEDILPSTEVINFFPADFTFGIIGNNQNQLVISTPSPYNVKIANPNCNAGNQQDFPIDWQMTDENEFIDISIIDRGGVDPGQEKIYTLITNTGIKFNLFMQQSSSASEHLIQETWRLKINADIVPIDDEICNTGQVYPSPGVTPWQREFPKNTSIGSTWTLYTPSNAVLTDLTATLHLTLHKLNFPHCVN